VSDSSGDDPGDSGETVDSFADDQRHRAAASGDACRPGCRAFVPYRMDESNVAQSVTDAALTALDDQPG
jgi:hypothetical protein